MDRCDHLKSQSESGHGKGSRLRIFSFLLATMESGHWVEAKGLALG